jgi:hypothetical protein
MCLLHMHVHIVLNMKLYIAFKRKTKFFALGLERNVAFNGIRK